MVSLGPKFCPEYLLNKKNELNINRQPIHQKRAIIYGLIDRAILLSDNKFHKTNLQKVYQILINNDYPAKFIKTYCDIRKKYLAEHNYILPRNELLKQHYANLDNLVIPYQRGLFESLRKILSQYDILAVPKKLNTNTVVIKNKNKTPKFDENSVVYLLECISCVTKYVGQTKRALKDRIYQHTISKPGDVVADHKINNLGHDFDYDNVKILHKESNHEKRLMVEMIHIAQTDNTINLQTDTEKLNKSYLQILTELDN